MDGALTLVDSPFSGLGVRAMAEPPFPKPAKPTNIADKRGDGNLVSQPDGAAAFRNTI